MPLSELSTFAPQTAVEMCCPRQMVLVPWLPSAHSPFVCPLELEKHGSHRAKCTATVGLDCQTVCVLKYFQFKMQGLLLIKDVMWLTESVISVVTITSAIFHFIHHLNIFQSNIWQSVICLSSKLRLVQYEGWKQGKTTTFIILSTSLQLTN